MSYLSANGVLHHALHWLCKLFNSARLSVIYVHEKSAAFPTPMLVLILPSLFSQNLVRKYIAHRKLARAFGIKADLFFSMARQPLVGQALHIIKASRSPSDTPHSVDPLCISDQPNRGT